MRLSGETADNTSLNNFFIIGNNLSLDFINTEFVENGERKDALSNFADLLTWAVAVNLLEAKQRTTLLREFGAEHPAQTTFSEAIKFRSDLRAMIEGLEKGKKVAPQIISSINEMLRRHSGYTELVRTENGFSKRFRSEFQEISGLLAPVAEAAADLLCYVNPVYLRKCENPECILHFYDTSKNHKRRWCSMAGCGNRAKAAAFYNRKKSNANAKQ
jgi:predicted RNA-binding Zn ribbon-like protein